MTSRLYLLGLLLLATWGGANAAEGERLARAVKIPYPAVIAYRGIFTNRSGALLRFYQRPPAHTEQQLLQRLGY